MSQHKCCESENEGDDLEVLDGDLTDDREELEDSDGECPPPGDGDCVDEALEDVMKRLEQSGYSASDSEDAVYDAMADLVAEGEVTDTPEMVCEDNQKQDWIQVNIPKIINKLKQMGLDFN